MENFIPYELYLKLNEKGFNTEKFSDDDIFGFYLERRSNKEIIPRSVAFCEYNQNIQQWNRLPQWEIAPLYSQILEWLRENHKIDIWVERFNSPRFFYQCPQLNDNENKLNHWADSHSQALINAITEAIKLI